jgi:3-hydroxybutyryl-CoA dehydrogenase
MKLEEIQNIAVLGAGIMGHGIAQSFIMGGYPVRLHDIQESILETAKSHMERSLELFSQAGHIAEGDVAHGMQRLTTTTDLGHAVGESDFVVEAVSEDLPLKQGLFQKVESLCKHNAIIASNTSSLTLKDIGALVKDRERLVITHWINPPQIVPTVEVVKGEETSAETLDTAYALLKEIGKQPVKIQRELPGFVVNRIQMAMVREVFDLYEKGLASAEDIDKAVKGSIGFRLASIGPFLTADLGGLDLWLKVCKNLFPLIQSSTDPPKALERLVSQGHHGIKSGKGFYDYSMDFSKGELDEVIKKRDRAFLRRLKNLCEDESGAEN